MRTLTSVLVATALLSTTGVAAPPAGATPGAGASRTTGISWRACTDGSLAASGVECGMLSVPLDYSHPHGTHIKIAVSRRVHTSTPYAGVILVNPGGPGGSGLGYATLGDDVPGDVGARYDWVGFDPRGVGSSRPAMHCVDNYFQFNRPDYRPRTSALVHAWKKRSKHYAGRCARKYPALIKHMTTAEVARDMNQIRKALGVTQISYYGFSYGTYLGQVYATLFPTHLRRMVLDSTVNSKRVWYRSNLDQDVAFNRNLKIWFRWVARYHGVYRVGDTMRKVKHNWYAALNRLARHPAGDVLGPDEWTDAFLYAGYYRDVWTRLGHAFSRYVHGGHWRAAAQFYADYNSPGDDNSFAVYSAVQCTDAPWPATWAKWRSDNDKIYAKAPFLTWANVWFNAPCLYWHAPARHAVTIRGGKAPSVLLIDETLDAATPFEGSLVTRRLFPHSSLIAEPGGISHADSLSGDKCVDSRIARYLDTGARPPRQDGDGPDLRCKPLPEPVPAGH